MFSDYKMRGFNLEHSQIERTDRLDRLVLVLSLALYWAVSTGMWDAMENKTPAEKKTRQRNVKTLRCLISWFKRGLRRFQFCLQRLIPPRLCGLLGKVMGGKAEGYSRVLMSMRPFRTTKKLAPQ